MAAFTFVELRPMDGVERALNPDATIGREGCDVVLHDPQVSRRHAALRLTERGPAVEDFASTNGTWVNGERIDGVRLLREDDVVRFGKTEWVLRAAGPDDRGAPRVTEVRPVVTEAHPSAPATQAPPRDPATQAPPQTPPRAPATEPGRRGDVPPPPAVTPSAVHRIVPNQSGAAAPPFAPAGAMQARGSAATRTGYTLFCLALLAATTVALVVYLAAS